MHILAPYGSISEFITLIPLRKLSTKGVRGLNVNEQVVFPVDAVLTKHHYSKSGSSQSCDIDKTIT